MPDGLIAQAPAKLNLALAVGPPDRGGFHPICSWMLTVNLYDDLTVTRLPEDRRSRYAILWHEDAKRPTEIDWSITSDLAVRAHFALEVHMGRSLPLQLKLEKRIPVGGGLGGGSSDGAVMLHAVNALYELGLTTEELAAIGAELGSDVPYLTHGGSAIVEGRGERVERHESIPPLHAVIAFPDAVCPTGMIYRLYDEIAPGPLRADAVRKLAASALPGAPRPDGLFNDLSRPAIRTAARLEEDLARMSALAERPAHISGSGSSIFVICDDERHAEFLAATLEREHDLPAVAVRGVEGHSLQMA